MARAMAPASPARLWTRLMGRR
uniref:Uncharacterized protein n=1 Tax=Macrostomum lignano TaxID=282301 RepID=A0A1I8FJZ6_9PLAT